MRPTQPPSRLNTSIPFRSSRLATPPSPFSPITPISVVPSVNPRTYSTSTTSSNSAMQLPAREPMNWLWACHICHRTYRLGVTRRCLDDGHKFCSGTTTIHNRDGTKRTKRHRACASEFDYAGWKTWGVWRRSITSPCTSTFEDDSEDEVQEITDSVVSPITPGKPSAWLKNQTKMKNCWGECDYPSQCRWGKQYGVDTPVVATFSGSQGDSSDTDMTLISNPIPAIDFEGILTAEKRVAEAVDGVEESDSAVPGLQDLANLVTRGKRRNSKTEIEHSPLAIDTSVSSAGEDQQTQIRQSGSRETLRKAYEGLDLEVRKGFGTLASIFRGGASVWRAEKQQDQQMVRRRSSIG